MKRQLFTVTLIFLVFAVLAAHFTVFAQEVSDTTASSQEEAREVKEALKVDEIIMEHVMDSHQWHVTKTVVLPLPIIVYSPEQGLDIFSSAHLYNHHKPIVYKGYQMTGEKIYRADSGHRVLDFSITKNVMMLFINCLVMILVLMAVAAGYRKNTGKAPRGIQSFLEPVILFVKDSIAKPAIGPRYQTYLPYLLTLFFFILFGNLLGLLPGAGNLTGNIAVTMVLAILTFLITNFSGNKTYWGHIFWTPGVPIWLRWLILPIELIGVFTKPFALTVRLFVAITAGHIVLLALLSLTFIFESWLVGIGATIFVVLISVIELLVAGIQAYVFALFTALYIGSAIHEHEHEHEHGPEHAVQGA
jgi:F-type H+-transporting ATPase subunit a